MSSPALHAQLKKNFVLYLLASTCWHPYDFPKWLIWNVIDLGVSCQ